MKVRFLLDEHLDPAIQTGLRRLNAAIDIVRIGDLGVPARATPDPDILIYVERSQRVLVTNNRASMAGHIADHYSASGRHWGILTVRGRIDVGTLIEELHLIWEASEAEEWHDRVAWIPL